jgi:PAS domain S-box-containing protein
MVDSPDELQSLRRTLRDVLAFTALPLVWGGYSSEQIANNLVDVLERTVGCDAMYLRAGSQEQTLEIGRTASDSAADAGLLERLRELAERPLRSDGTVPAGDGGEARVLSFALSADARDRFVVACRRAGFPTDSERLLLRLATSQALTWMERKNAEAALAAESRWRRGIEESMAAGVAAVDRDGKLSYVNRAFTTMTGFTVAELVGSAPPFAFWAPEDDANIRWAFQDALSGSDRSSSYEMRFRRRDEQRFDALVLISRFAGEEGRDGFVASVYDVTQRKAAERATAFMAEASGILSRSLEYGATLEAIGALIVPRMADWCFVDLVEANGGFQRAVVAHADAAQAPLAQRFKRSYLPISIPYGVSETLAGGRTTLMNDVTPDVLLALARDDDHREALLAVGIQCFVSVPMTSGGRTLGVITLMGTGCRSRFEAPEVAAAEELARRAGLAIDNARLYREAQEANRVKDEFLANLSHELRTPMTAILGWAHLLQVGGLDAEQVQLGIDTIRQSGQAQAKLIDELLDVSRIVSGKLYLNPAPLDLSRIVRAAAAAIRPAAEAKRHRLDLDVEVEQLPTSGDAARLQQVFWNLLSNAVKFTPAGGSIRITVARPDADTAVVSVVDSGEGIPAAFLPLVFERFKQAATVVRGRTGLGLGLAIAKDLVELHGGSIEAKSAGPGQGSTFTVTLPVQRVAASPVAGQRGRVRLQGRRVLLVDDDAATRTLMSTALLSFGAEVRAAESASDALKTVGDFAPEILISDIEMPGNDGITLLHELRHSQPGLPAIAVTGYADDSSRDRILAAGFDGFIAKPLDPQALAREVERALLAG